MSENANKKGRTNRRFVRMCQPQLNAFFRSRTHRWHTPVCTQKPAKNKHRTRRGSACADGASWVRCRGRKRAGRMVARPPPDRRHLSHQVPTTSAAGVAGNADVWVGVTHPAWRICSTKDPRDDRHCSRSPLPDAFRAHQSQHCPFCVVHARSKRACRRRLRASALAPRMGGRAANLATRCPAGRCAHVHARGVAVCTTLGMGGDRPRA